MVPMFIESSDLKILQVFESGKSRTFKLGLGSCFPHEARTLHRIHQKHSCDRTAGPPCCILRETGLIAHAQEWRCGSFNLMPFQFHKSLTSLPATLNLIRSHLKPSDGDKHFLVLLQSAFATGPATSQDACSQKACGRGHALSAAFWRATPLRRSESPSASD